MKMLNNLVVEKPSQEIIDKAIHLNFWMIGPASKKYQDAELKDGIFVWGFVEPLGNSGDQKIISIAIDDDIRTLYVLTRLHWYVCASAKSAYMAAKYLDMILDGSYTYVVPLNTREVTNQVTEINMDKKLQFFPPH